MEGEKVKKLTREKSKIDSSILQSHAFLALITGSLAVLVGVFTTLNLVDGHTPFFIFLGTMFIVSSIVQGIGVMRILKNSLITITKVVVEALLGILFITWAGIDFSTAFTLLMVYFSASIFANIMLAIELNPLKGWGISALIAVIKVALVLFFIMEGFDYGLHRTISSTVGLNFVLDGILFIYLSVMANLKEYDSPTPTNID
jgi:uncharacterized membrane protein HdeD (DUF308 family)